MSKKGNLARMKVAGFVLAVFVAVVILSFLGKISFVANEISVEEQCRASVIRNARYHVAGLELGSEIDCPTRNLELKNDLSQDEAKEKLAKAMYTCWRQFGQGKLNLFSGDGVYCNVCYIVDVKTKEPITGFTEYLLKTPSPTENKYYYDYLGSFETTKADEVLGEIDLNRIRLDDYEISNKPGDNKYAVLFVYAKGQDNFEKIKRQLLAQSAAGKVITPVATGVSIAAGVGTAVAIITAPVSVPVIVVVGAAVAVGTGVFVATQWVGSLFNPDSPPDWAAFNLLRAWNPDETPAILKEELGCRQFVETQSN